jgi:hypothetical protein
MEYIIVKIVAYILKRQQKNTSDHCAELETKTSKHNFLGISAQ